MKRLTPTNYLLINRPEPWRDVYPLVDIDRVGERWLGADYQWNGKDEKRWLERLSFFHYLHSMIWKDLVINETPYRFTREQVREYHELATNKVPLLINSTLEAMDNFLDTSQGYPFLDDTQNIIRDIASSRMSRYFLLLHIHNIPVLPEDAVLCLVFICLIGHQFMDYECQDDYKDAPPPFKIVNSFGYAFDDPANSLETVSLYPCGFKDGSIIFGAINDYDNYIALYPQSTRMGNYPIRQE